MLIRKEEEKREICPAYKVGGVHNVTSTLDVALVANNVKVIAVLLDTPSCSRTSGLFYNSEVSYSRTLGHTNTKHKDHSRPHNHILPLPYCLTLNNKTVAADNRPRLYHITPTEDKAFVLRDPPLV